MNQDRSAVRQDLRTSVIMLMIAVGIWLFSMVGVVLVWMLAVPHPSPPEPLPWRAVEQQHTAPDQGAQLHLDAG